MIVNSLRELDGAIPHGCPEPRRRPQSAQKIALILDRAPKHLKPELIALTPKLVDYSEHPLAAYALLNHIQKPGAEPSLKLPVRYLWILNILFLGSCSLFFYYLVAQLLQKELLDHTLFMIVQVLSALSQLEFGAEVWEIILCQALELLPDSNDEPLAAVISFVFRAASQCQHLSQAVRIYEHFLVLLSLFLPKMSDCVFFVAG